MATASRPTGASGLVPMTPAQQLRAGRTPRRLTQLLVGLVIYGASMALMIKASLGLDPWDVLHQGIQRQVGFTFGQVAIATGALVLLAWIPLRQWPGLGTVLNVFVVGLSTDATLALLHDLPPLGLAGGLAMLVAGVVLNGLASGLYIGSQFGPGPRDGLMTGLSQRTGLSIRLVRTALEVTVVAIGWLLGGQVGLGTVLYALAIGPLVQFFLPPLTVALDAPGAAHAPR